MLAEVFLLWTFWFWVLIAAELAILFIAAAWEKGWLAGLSFLLVLALLTLFGDFNVPVFLYHHPVTVLAGVGIYLLGGSVYVFPKWYLYVTDHKRRYLDAREEFLAEKGLKNISEAKPGEWKEAFSRKASWGDRCIEFIPQVRNHKGRIMDWMMLWPFNFLWTLLNDPIKRFFQHVYYMIADALQNISNKVFADVSEDMK